MADEIAPIADPIHAQPAESTYSYVLANNPIVRSWLHGRTENTVTAYTRDVAKMFAFIAKPLEQFTLADLQDFADSLTGRDSTRARTLKACKSLLTFAERIGAIQFNVGAALRVPKSRDGLADRILTVREVRKMIRAAATPRDAALVSLLYQGGFRRAELVSLTWSAAAEAEDGSAFLTVVGKGAKTRTVRISSDVWALVRSLRGDAAIDAPMFVGRSGALDPSWVRGIVRATARRAGIEKPVSPHFLRHSHASHALDKGAPIALVRDTLGHSSVAVTDRYLHARPKESSGKYL